MFYIGWALSSMRTAKRQKHEDCILYAPLITVRPNLYCRGDPKVDFFKTDGFKFLHLSHSEYNSSPLFNLKKFMNKFTQIVIADTTHSATVNTACIASCHA